MTNLKFFNGVALISAFALFSCSTEESRVTASDTSEVISESLTDAYFEDVDDMAIAAVADQNSPAGGRATSDERFCAGLQFDGTASSGVVVIDFGAGCTGPRGNVRTGKLILNYSGGPVGTTGFTVVTTFDNYTINGVSLSGTRTVTLLESTAANQVRHAITLTDGVATWPDQSQATRASSFVREVDTDLQRVSLTGEASGVNRNGRAYEMNILETVVYQRSCVVEEGIHMAVSGVKRFQSGNRQLTINYGSGACDRSVTVTVDDASTTLSVGS